MEHEMKDVERLMSSVTVGPKGQIVIPKEMRDMFDIKPGDKLLVMADSSRGIAVQRQDVMNRIADAIFSGHGKEYMPEEPEAHQKQFAEVIRQQADGEENEK